MSLIPGQELRRRSGWLNPRNVIYLCICTPGCIFVYGRSYTTRVSQRESTISNTFRQIIYHKRSWYATLGGTRHGTLSPCKRCDLYKGLGCRTSHRRNNSHRFDRVLTRPSDFWLPRTQALHVGKSDQDSIWRSTIRHANLFHVKNLYSGLSLYKTR